MRLTLARRVELTTAQMQLLEHCSRYFMFFDKVTLFRRLSTDRRSSQDRSGALDRTEFAKLHVDLIKHYPGKLGPLESAFQKLDSNGDGVISCT